MFTNKKIISYKEIESLEEYPEYRNEQNIYSITDHYANLWNNRNIYNYKIPLNIFQTWHTKNLPPFMAKNIENLQKMNPEFKYQLFDDNDCYDFIKMNYSKDILDAYILLKPGAYKADLWRYCILYKYGGIYLDIKFESVNDFKLINLIENENENDFFVQDNIYDGIYNAFMICQPNNDILLRCITKVINNVKIRYYGNSSLCVTGPKMMYDLFNEKEKNDLLKLLLHQGGGIISCNGIIIFKEYFEYRNEQIVNSITSHYGNLWDNHDIYNDCIPLNIFQTWHTKNLPPFMTKNIENLQKMNPEFKYQLFDDNDCYDFIKMNYSKDILDAYILLKPSAYKADLWRYCILYKYGGIYLDIKFESVDDFKLITLKKELFVQDNIHDGIYNGFMICQPNNDILLRCINKIINNVKNRYYGNDPFCVTGSKMMYDLFDKKEKNNLLLHQGGSSISYNGIIIFKEYFEYKNEEIIYNDNYHNLWYNHDIYNNNNNNNKINMVLLY
jgi:mannosyltransferase OCH1-like enzyme